MPPRKAPVATAKPGGRVREDFVRDVSGVEVRLPSLGYLKPGLVRRIRNLTDVNAMFTLMETVLSPAALDALDEMDPEDYNRLVDDWREHSGVTLGES